MGATGQRAPAAAAEQEAITGDYVPSTPLKGAITHVLRPATGDYERSEINYGDFVRNRYVVDALRAAQTTLIGDR